MPAPSLIRLCVFVLAGMREEHIASGDSEMTMARMTIWKLRAMEVVVLRWSRALDSIPVIATTKATLRTTPFTTSTSEVVLPLGFAWDHLRRHHMLMQIERLVCLHVEIRVIGNRVMIWSRIRDEFCRRLLVNGRSS